MARQGIANTPSECFLLFSGSRCQGEGFFLPLPATDSSASIFPLLGESDCTKPLESIGYEETTRQSQSRFCKHWAGPRRWTVCWLKWSKTSKPVQAGNLVVAALFTRDMLYSLHHISNTLTKRGSIKAVNILLIHSA